MATDKLMNHSQGESIITNLGTIATNLQNVTAISPAKFGMGYAVCDTAAGTAAKTANIANYVLTEGALVTVKFTNANTASNATLNLNNTGAKPILYKGSALTTDIISAGDICTFIYSTANDGSYSIINVDALSGAGAGTVKSVGAEGGIITDQTAGAAISTTGNVKLNLKSDTAFTATAPDPVEIENKIYPVALDASGHPAVSVPGTTYTEGDGIDITNNVIKNTGVTAIAPSDSSTGTNGTIRVTTNGTTAEVAVKGLNNAAYKDVSTAIPATGAVDTKVATEKAVADSISSKAIGTNSSTTNAIATFAGTDGKTLADSAVTIAKNATGVTDDDTKVPTSKAVKTYVDATATGISRYIGTITAASQLSTTAKKGDFYIVSTAWTGVHTGDEIIAEKDNPTATIDGTNWTLLHNEADTNTTYTFAEGTTNGKFTVTPSDTGTAQSVTVHGLAASAYKGVDTTPTASSSNLVESGGVATALGNKQDTLTFDGTYNASTNKAATVSTVTNAIGALDVSEVSVGSTKTINKISQTDGKISVSTTDIRSASTSQTGIVQLNDAINNTSTAQAATANAVKKVNDKVTTCETNILCALNKTGTNWLYDYEHGMENPTTLSGVTFTWLKNGKLSIKSTGINTSNVWYDLEANIRSKYIGKILSFVGGVDNKCVLNVTTTGGTSVAVSSGDDVTIPSTGTNKVYILVLANAGEFDIVVEPMIRDATITSNTYSTPSLPNSDLTQGLAELNAHPFLTVPINHNMVYRGQNLGTALTDAQHTALSSGNFTDLYLGDYWTKSVTIPAFYEVTTAEPANWSTNYTSYYTKSGNTYTAVSGSSAPTWAANTYYERQVPEQTVTLKAVIADFDTFYAGYASGYAGINTHHAAVIVTGFSNVVWNGTNSTAGGYVNSLIHKWLVNSALPQIETWFGSAKVLSHQKLLTNAITGDAASGWAWSSQKISLLSENQVYGSKVWGNSKAANGGYEPGEAFKHLNVFNHIDANLLFGNKNIWLRDIASAVWAAYLSDGGYAGNSGASASWIAPAALILLS